MMRLDGRKADVQVIALLGAVMFCALMIIINLLFSHVYSVWLTLEEAAQAGIRAASVEVAPRKRCQMIREAVGAVMFRAQRNIDYEIAVVYTPGTSFREAAITIIVKTDVNIPLFSDVFTLQSSYSVRPDTFTSMINWRGCS